MACFGSHRVPWIHRDVECSECGIRPISGIRMNCTSCKSRKHDLCKACFIKLGDSRKLEGCFFEAIEVDSSGFTPHLQIRYISCSKCHATPIQGPRYRREELSKTICRACFNRGSELSQQEYTETTETKIVTLCETYRPAFHLHKKCGRCDQLPIVGPRYDKAGGHGESFCEICYEAKKSKLADYKRVERPEGDSVFHLMIICCQQCGQTPIRGPAYVNQLNWTDAVCLQCHQHLDKSRKKTWYRRLGPPVPHGVSHIHGVPMDLHFLLIGARFDPESPPDSRSSSKDQDLHKRKRKHSAILAEKPDVKWDNVAGLESARQALQEAVLLPAKYPQYFNGYLKPWNAFLLFGPPGTGKTYLAKALATEMDATFFSISSSDLKDKWHGRSEQKVVKLFKSAREAAPSVIFIDEIDSVAGTRRDNCSRGMTTELMVQMQGVRSNDSRVLVVGATNLPYNLDQAIRRRFEKRICVPLPEEKARKAILKIHIQNAPNSLTEADFDEVASKTPGFSGSDIAVCMKDVLLEPLRRLFTAQYFRCEEDIWRPCERDDPGTRKIAMKELEVEKPAPKIEPQPVSRSDFIKVLLRQRPTVSRKDLELHRQFAEEFGEGLAGEEQRDHEETTVANHDASCALAFLASSQHKIISI